MTKNYLKCKKKGKKEKTQKKASALPDPYRQSSLTYAIHRGELEVVFVKKNVSIFFFQKTVDHFILLTYTCGFTLHLGFYRCPLNLHNKHLAGRK